MILRKLYDRLRRLECRATATPADDAAELAERQQLLSFLSNDSESLRLYHRYLEVIGRTCVHESLGVCALCWKSRLNSEEAKAALREFEDRIHALSPVPVPVQSPTTEGEQS